MSTPSFNQPSPDSNNNSEFQSFSPREFVRDAVTNILEEGRAQGNLGDYDNALTMLSNYLNRDESVFTGPGKLSSISETLSALDMVKQTGGLLEHQKWDYGAPAVRLGVARDAGLIDLYKDPDRRNPVPTFAATDSTSLMQLEKTYNAALTDEGALKLSIALAADYLSVHELASKSFDDYNEEKKDAVLEGLRDSMKEALESGQLKTFTDLREEALDIADRFDQEHELKKAVINQGHQIDEARQDLSETMGEPTGSFDIRECTGQELLGVAASPEEFGIQDKSELKQALVEKSSEVFIALNELSRSQGLDVEALSKMDARGQVLEQVSNVASLSTEEDIDDAVIGAAAEVLKDSMTSYRRLSGEDFTA